MSAFGRHDTSDMSCLRDATFFGHPLPLDKIGLSFKYNDALSSITVSAVVKVTHKTGVEMEALTAVSVACLTIYDMTKALSHDIVIGDIHLVNKTGGKSDYRHV